MNNINNLKYQIGDFVWVRAEARKPSAYKSGNVERRVLRYRAVDEQGYFGRVIGIKRLFVGVIDEVLTYYNDGSIMGDYRYLNIDGSVLLWAVRFGLTNKEVYAHEKDLVPAVRGANSGSLRLPWFTRTKGFCSTAWDGERDETSP